MLGFKRPSYVAKNIIVALDFDGCIAYGDKLKVTYAKKLYGIDVSVEQCTKKTFPLGAEKYTAMMRIVTVKAILEYELARDCKSELESLYVLGFRFAVVTSRLDELDHPELDAARDYCRHHGLPISYYHSTNEQPKDIVCRKLHALAIIDDTLDKLLPLREVGMHLFFLRQPWNAHEHISLADRDQITEVGSWAEFGQSLRRIRLVHEAVCKKLSLENAWRSLPIVWAYIRDHPDETRELYHSYRG